MSLPAAPRPCPCQQYHGHVPASSTTAMSLPAAPRPCRAAATQDDPAMTHNSHTTAAAGLQWPPSPAAPLLIASHRAAQRSTAQRSAAQHSTAQHSTAQHSAPQHSTAQHSTAQHSTAPAPGSARCCRVSQGSMQQDKHHSHQDQFGSTEQNAQ
jgi:hypothetical protein